MGLDKRFRVAELVQSGSRAIISENEEGEHTFVVPSPEGDRDGETYGYVEKPSYNNEELKRALDTAVDELFIPPENELPEVVPLATFNRLQTDFASASLEIVSSSIQIDQLQSSASRLEAASASLSILYSQSQFDLNQTRDLAQSQSLEITAKTKKIQELNTYIESLETDLENIEPKFDSIFSQAEGAISTVRELQETTAGIRAEASTVISNIQTESIVQIGRKLQSEIGDVRRRTEQTEGGLEQARGGLQNVLDRLSGFGSILSRALDSIFNRR